MAEGGNIMMKLVMLAEDDGLKEEMLRIPRTDEEWTFFRHPDALGPEAASGADFIVVSDRYFDDVSLLEWVERLRELVPGCRPIVLLTNRHHAAANERLLKLCLGHRLDYVLPGRSAQGVAEAVHSIVHGSGRKDPRKERPLVVFVGSTPNIGTTVVSFGTALQLARETRHMVGYLCLNLKSSKLYRYLGRDESISALDDMRADLRSRSLTPERLLQYCETLPEVPRLRILYGNRVREQAEYFTPEEIEHLLEAARRAFDICLVEVSAYWDNAATVCAVLRADRRIAVTTQELSHFQEDLQRWLKTVAAMYGVEASSFDLVVTQREKSGLLQDIRLKDIRREAGMQIIGEIQRHAQLGEYLNQGRLLELLNGPHAINRELSGVTQTLITLCGLMRQPVPAKRGWRKGWLSRAGTI
jgi:hypothetical protein